MSNGSLKAFLPVFTTATACMEQSNAFIVHVCLMTIVYNLFCFLFTAGYDPIATITYVAGQIYESINVFVFAFVFFSNLRTVSTDICSYKC